MNIMSDPRGLHPFFSPLEMFLFMQKHFSVTQARSNYKREMRGAWMHHNYSEKAGDMSEKWRRADREESLFTRKHADGKVARLLSQCCVFFPPTLHLASYRGNLRWPRLNQRSGWWWWWWWCRLGSFLQRLPRPLVRPLENNAKRSRFVDSSERRTRLYPPADGHVSSRSLWGCASTPSSSSSCLPGWAARCDGSQSGDWRPSPGRRAELCIRWTLSIPHIPASLDDKGQACAWKGSVCFCLLPCDWIFFIIFFFYGWHFGIWRFFNALRGCEL